MMLQLSQFLEQGPAPGPFRARPSSSDPADEPLFHPSPLDVLVGLYTIELPGKTHSWWEAMGDCQKKIGRQGRREGVLCDYGADKKFTSVLNQ